MGEQHVTDEQESVFAAMRRQIALTPMPGPQPATLRQRLASHPRLSAGGASALVAAAAAAVLFGTGAITNAPPAFAVTVSGNSVTITLHEFGALNSLNARLAAENLPIRAVPVVAGCTAIAQLVGANGPVTRTIKAGWVSGPGTLTIELTHRRPPPGDTLVVGASGGHSLLLPQEIEGPVPRCIGAGSTLSHAKRVP
ncbi:MAG: hypothetical protein ACYCXW_14490 [Solirubrobacteraceae bacterium]